MKKTVLLLSVIVCLLTISCQQKTVVENSETEWISISEIQVLPEDLYPSSVEGFGQGVYLFKGCFTKEIFARDLSKFMEENSELRPVFMLDKDFDRGGGYLVIFEKR